MEPSKQSRHVLTSFARAKWYHPDMDTIYIDSLFLINLAVNYVILLATGKLCGASLKRLRLGLGAAVGGVYAVLTVVPQTAFLAGPVMKVASAVLMLLIAYGGEKRLLRTSVVFFAVSAAFAGAVYAVSLMGGGTGSGTPYVPVSARVLLLSFAVSYLLITVVFRRIALKNTRELLDVELSLSGRKAAFRALRDTGNTLHDPVSGASVMVADPEALLPALPENAADELMHASDPIELMVALGRLEEKPGRFRLVPYSSVGVDSGMLVCFRPDELKINGAQERDLLVAISRTRLCADGEYSAVI